MTKGEFPARDPLCLHLLNAIANQVFYLACCHVTGAPAAFDTSEISEARWFTKDEIWQMLSAGEIKDG